jgi:hypothetical protein
MVHLDELYKFIFEIFSFELIYCFKIQFLNYLCLVLVKTLGKELLPSFKKTLGKETLCRVFFVWPSACAKKTLGKSFGTRQKSGFR